MTAKLDPGMVNAFVPGAATLSPEEEAMIERRQRLLGPAYRLFYERPVEIVRGQGVWLYGPRTATPISTSTTTSPPSAIAIRMWSRRSAARWQTLATNTRYLHDAILDYAEKLLATFPAAPRPRHVHLHRQRGQRPGHRIARAVTGGTGFIVTETAYHGITDAVSQISPSLGSDVSIWAPHVRTVPAPDALSRRRRRRRRSASRADVEAAIADLQRHGIKPAALIADTIFSSDGVMPEPAGFLAGRVAEAQQGAAACSSPTRCSRASAAPATMWGFERHGVVPDIVTLGKPMGNGQPIAGLLVRRAWSRIRPGPRYFNTFGGNHGLLRGGAGRAGSDRA